MTAIHTFFLLALAACTAADAAVQPGNPDSPGKSFFAATPVKAPMHKNCAIVVEVSAHPNLMPGMEMAQVAQPAEEHSLVDTALKSPVGKIKKARLKNQAKTHRIACHMDWKVIPSEEMPSKQPISDTAGHRRWTPYM